MAHLIRLYRDLMRRYKAAPEVQPDVARFSAEAVTPLIGFGRHDPVSVDREQNGVRPILGIRRKIMRTPPPRQTPEITVAGVFFPAILLCSGWWERQHKKKLVKQIEWRDGLQNWLFSGFEQWGPSWNINPDDVATSRYLFGQIGEGDEADSLPVLIANSKAQSIRERISSGDTVFNVTVRGFLYHRQQINDPELKEQVGRWGKIFDYCLLVSDAEASHGIFPKHESPDRYSAYLWQCWLPEKWAQVSMDANGNSRLEPPDLRNVFFPFEHTDLTKPDAILYNLDSLRRKEDFLKGRYGNLILVQKSSDVVAGEQALCKEDFCRLVTESPLPDLAHAD